MSSPARASGVLSERKPGFRADVEGLRAVAIALVAVYHVWVGRVSGGVDVFLMISGFFVGASVVRAFSERRPPALGAYYRRIFGRLLPPALIVLTAVLVSTWFFLPRTRMTETAQQGLASLFYYENWYLATTGQDYGAADVSQSMTQHFWSLSVQGQIFLAMPLLLLVVSMVLGRRVTRRALLSVVSVLAVSSFVYATYLVQVDQGFAYYNTGARLWEYLAGTLLAFVAASRVIREMPLWVRNALAAAGLALVLAAGVLVDGSASFPGPATLVPVLGAAAIVLAGAGAQPRVSAVLSTPALVAAGSHAYSFYLWHWPVLVLVLALREGRPVGWLAGSGILVVSAALAWSTDRFLAAVARRDHGEHGAHGGLNGPVEHRLAPTLTGLRSVRRAVFSRPALTTACALVVVVGSASWLVTTEIERRTTLGTNALDASVYPGALAAADPAVWPAPEGVTPYPGSVLAQADWPGRERAGCTADSEENHLYRCVLGEAGAPRRVALVGGSHSVNFLVPLDEVARFCGVEVVTYFKKGCPVRLVDGDDSSCQMWSQAVIHDLVDTAVDAVFLTGTRPAPDSPGDRVPTAYLNVWQELFDNDIPVVAIRDNPWLPFNAAECVELLGAEGCTVDRSEVLADVNPLDALVEQIELLYAVDFSDVFCGDGVCRSVIGNVLAYIDDNHLTATFNGTLSSLLDEQVGAATAWW